MHEKFVSGLGPTILAIVWSFFALGTMLMGMRIYTNAFIIRTWNGDFWLALGSYIAVVSASISLTICVEFGLGAHLATLLELHPELAPINQLWQWIFTTLGILSVALGKLAIVQFLLEVEGTTSSNRKWILYFFGVVNSCVTIPIFPIIWIQCTPVATLWNSEIPGICLGRNRNMSYGYFLGAWGAFVDLALAVYPVIIFWSLQLRLHVKIGLMVLFGFGIVACICSVIKTTELSALTGVSDITYSVARLDIWAAIEIWVIFIVGCIPTVRPIFIKAFGRVTTSGRPTSYAHQPDQLTPNTPIFSPSRKHFSWVASLTANSGNDSEENILPEELGIVMIRNVSAQDQNESGRCSLYDV